ncbi:hypothetical protein K469DRAFT_715783 [Zopfia rhizophila CBS 207.26]|uniref:Uncharacterized protein n=1 Tax=Zopfia rhizophila CBS 207.26 TaxID=1314779 RepID=A0A6A6DM32_9PEZI|nr:hypothetical protein K469DRAFT_715783 [Zopfia rhizophila CBS 207.26]
MSTLTVPRLRSFLSLAAEIRLQIYEYYLPHVYVRIDSSGYHLPALLLTCRTVYEEAFPLMASNVVFSFFSTGYFIDFFSAISQETTKKIRHVFVHGTPFHISDPGEKGRRHSYDIRDAIEYFPGLQLETLSIRDPYHGPNIDECDCSSLRTYYNLEYFAAHGRGWRELRVYLTSTACFNVEHPHFDAQPQPADWDAMMKWRDGKDGGAKVQIYVARYMLHYPNPHENTPRGKLARAEASQRERPWQVEWPDMDEKIFWSNRFTRRYRRSRKPQKRPTMVIMRRDKDADIVQDIAPMGQSIRTHLEHHTWQQMMELGIFRSGDNDPTHIWAGMYDL